MSSESRVGPDGCVRAVRVGPVREQHWSGRTIVTGAAKAPVSGSVLASAEGLAGDAQGNLRVHGGPDKAICCYPVEHYADWRAEGIDLPAGAFFENLELEGLVDAEVFLGDVFTIGEAGLRVQVTAPRRPCTTVSARWSMRELPRLMQDRGRTGYYLRVLEPGPIEAGDAVRIVMRLERAVSVAETNRVMNVDRADRAGIVRLLSAPELPARWRTLLEARLEGVIEDDSARLGS